MLESLVFDAMGEFRSLRRRYRRELIHYRKTYYKLDALRSRGDAERDWAVSCRSI